MIARHRSLSILLLLPLPFFFSLGCMADDSVFDLGGIEVEGEVRRPMVHLIEKKKSRKQYYQGLLKMEFDAFERSLLQRSASNQHASGESKK